MKKTRAVILILILFFLWSGNPLQSREPVTREPVSSGERICLFCDRGFYVVSERLYFTAFYSKLESVPGEEWSRVMYIELLRWDGTPLVQAKAPILSGRASGSICLPSNINSGIYYLRAYTNWMRNFSPLSYSYIPVSVLNPGSEFTDRGPAGETLLSHGFNKEEIKNTDGICIEGLKEKYGKRAEAEITLSFSEELAGGNYSLSIIREEPEREHYMLTGSESIQKKPVEEYEFLPEINGLTLTGKVLDSRSGVSLSGAKINLSSFSTPFYYMSVVSDEEGRFWFTIPSLRGSTEFCVSAETEDSIDTKLLINSEFCNKQLTLPYIPFHLNKDEMEAAEETSFNAQVTDRFSTGSPVQQEVPERPFYGVPTSVTYLKDYIELEDLREFFYELVFSVSIAYIDREAYHLVVNLQDGSGPSPALVLMDNIPVANNKDLLRIPCKMIERIEVVDKAYICGDYKYGGIISLYSRNHNLAGILSGPGDRYFTYNLFGQEADPFSDSPEQVRDPFLPDRRNLLFREDIIRMTPERTASVQFSTSDASGCYLIRIQGTDRENIPVFAEKKFYVE